MAPSQQHQGAPASLPTLREQHQQQQQQQQQQHPQKQQGQGQDEDPPLLQLRAEPDRGPAGLPSPKYN